MSALDPDSASAGNVVEDKGNKDVVILYGDDATDTNKPSSIDSKFLGYTVDCMAKSAMGMNVIKSRMEANNEAASPAPNFGLAKGYGDSFRKNNSPQMGVDNAALHNIGEDESVNESE